jgi:endonuclease/exonuclease/phosphatase (EEP) superfamily protein YafD
VRVVTANALYDNATPDAWAEAALALDADVLVVQEYSLTIADALDRAGVTERYPEMEGKALPWSAGVALFSRYPLRRPSMSAVGDGIVAATVELGDLDVRVVNVHTSALQYQDEWRESFADLERFVAEQPFPLVVAGDFNATVWHRPMRDLLAGPLRDAHLDRGRGLAASWPEQRPGPPFALIDHVLVTPMIGVEDIGERRLPGSDHRAVVANLRLAAR